MPGWLRLLNANDDISVINGDLDEAGGWLPLMSAKVMKQILDSCQAIHRCDQ